MQQLKIDKEFQSLCPPLTPEELNLLDASLNTDGCKEAIETWANHQDTIIDGHNRYRICQSCKIDFKIKALKIETRGEVINYIIAKQLGRRNLTDIQKSALRGMRYNNEKKNVGEHKGNQHTLESVQNEHIPKTAERLGKEYGVNEGTIRRDADYASGLDKVAETLGGDVRSDLLAGKIKATKETIGKLKNAEPKEIKEVIEFAKKPKEKRPAKVNEHETGTMLGIGVLKANEAINALKLIPKNDPLRKRGFQIVTDWIKANK